MKRTGSFKWLALALIFCSSFQSITAQTLKDVFSSSETKMLYLGVDFTLARLLDDATADVPAIRDRHIPAINDLIVNEPKKYEIAKAFNKSNIDHDLGPVAKRNAKINLEGFTSTNSTDFDRLKKDDIEKLVKGFDFDGKKGLGLLLVVEGMSKARKGAAVWVTIVDMGTKKTLMAERVIGETGMSIGFRNYWAKPIGDVFNIIEKKKYKEWKSTYGG